MTSTDRSPTSPQLAPDHFDPTTVTEFRYLSRHLDLGTGEAVLRYALDELELTERFTFPVPLGELPAELMPRRVAVVERLLDHLWLVAGLSYFKMAAPPLIRIEAGHFHRLDIEFHQLLLRRGLGEFCFVNGLDPELSPTYEFHELDESPAPITSLSLDLGPLVPVGGGKDSCVSIEGLRAAGFEPTLVTVRRFPIIADVIEASGLPDLSVERVLDPMVAQLNARGALNGHVPATAIVSFAALIVAAWHGFDAVVMSNERSASEGNTLYRGVEINHQWSKSDEAESAIRATVARISPELGWFSILRPLSELHISQLFARHCSRYFTTFSSCNRSQVMDSRQRVARWCRRCPKCQFVYLALAASMPRLQLEVIFGEDLFSTSAIDGFRSLLGLSSWKPFECVGETGECRVALSILNDSVEWAKHPLLGQLIHEVRAAGLWPTATEVAEVYCAHSFSSVPQNYVPIVDSFGVDAPG